MTWVLATGRERAVALAHDMTQALRGTRDDLESTLNAIPDLLFELDPEGRILHFRSARSGLLEVVPETFLGHRLEELVPPNRLRAAGRLWRPPATPATRPDTNTGSSWGSNSTGLSCRLPARRAPCQGRAGVSLRYRATSLNASRPKHAPINWPTSMH